MTTAQGEPTIGALERLVGYHLRRASGAFSADFARATVELGLRQGLFGAITILAAHPGISQGVIGTLLGIQRANMVALVTELIDAGLVERQVATKDRRAFALTLTAAGTALHAEALARIEAHEARMLADLTGNERALLLNILKRIELRASAE